MDEHELGHAVIRVVRRLLLADEAEVPDVDPPVARRGREHGRVVRRPGEVHDLVRVALERVQPLRRRAQVVQRDGLSDGAREGVVNNGQEKGGETRRTLSELPVMSRCSDAGLNATARISRSWASDFVVGSAGARVSQLEKASGATIWFI